MKWKNVLVMILATGVGLGLQGSSVDAVTIGIRPCDGTTMVVKQFSVPAGTSINGVEFQNNDDRTVFPEVTLVRGVATALSQGTVVARESDIREASNGWVRVTWTTVATTSPETYAVAVRFPAGAGKQGAGSGPGIGATRVAQPSGCFVAGGEDGGLTAIPLDLEMNLLVSTRESGKAGSDEPLPGTARLFLGSASPNPFNPSTTIEFGVEHASIVRLSVYDIRGREVQTLLEEQLAAGTYRRVWDGRDTQGQLAAAGVYVVQLNAGDRLLQKKLTLLK